MSASDISSTIQHQLAKQASAMRDELEKIAATLDQLQAAYRRLPIIKFKVRPRSIPQTMTGDLKQLTAGAGMGGVNRLTAENARGLVPRAEEIARKQMAAFGPDVPEDLVQEAIEGAKKHLQGAASMGPYAGTIMRPRGGGVRSLEAGGWPVLEPNLFKNAPPEAKRGVNLVTGLHEAHETGVKKLAPFAGHLNPDVLAKEHNMVRSLSGPGAEETRGLMTTMRTQSAEAPGLQGYMEGVFGPRASEYAYGTGKKIPKAMRKRLSEHAAQEYQHNMTSF